MPHSGNKNYKGLLKALMRAAMEPLSVDDAKEVEQAVAGGWRCRGVGGLGLGLAGAGCCVT